MATLAALPTILAGDVPTGDDWAAYLANVAFLLKPPNAELQHSTGTSIPNTTFTAVPWNLEVTDTDVLGTGGHSTVTNTSRFTALYAGTYMVAASPAFTVNATGIRIAHIRLNGSVIVGSRSLVNFGAPVQHAVIPPRVREVPMVVGDYLEIFVYQDSGGALTLVSGAGEESGNFTIKWVST